MLTKSFWDLLTKSKSKSKSKSESESERGALERIYPVLYYMHIMTNELMSQGSFSLRE
jgi:hypothetical protein